MAFKRYTRSFAVELTFLLLLMLLFCFVLVVKTWFLASALLLILIFFSAFQLHRKIEQTNLRIASFFKIISSGDSTVRLSEKKQGAGFDLLHHQLNILSKKLQESEIARKQEQSLFFTVIEELNAGIFLLDSQMDLKIANPAARIFLNIRSEADKKILIKRAPHFISKREMLLQNGKTTVEFSRDGESQKWHIRMRNIRHKNIPYELYLVNNLQREMENKESEVIERLMHTLTHEIMNSISPVSSLTDTLQFHLNSLKSEGKEVRIPTEVFEDMKTSSQVIRKRSLGLINFVERYSMLARLPLLSMETIEGDKLIQELEILFGTELQRKCIDFEIVLASPGMRFRADKQLLLQVLINLVKNAQEALEVKDNCSIKIVMSKSNGYSYISVIDNAGGIPPEMQEDIFLPFFSTKSKGSGIGLSLSRNIIRAHHGRLYYKAATEGSEFRVELAD